jgi:predicted transcriptional regulator of viral defense system
VKSDRFFGVALYRPQHDPVRVTTPERTLLDGLLHPELCGGLQTVLSAWRQARDLLDLDTVVTLVDRFDVAILRQRAGFVLDELGLDHPAAAAWPALARRGGSSKLLGSEPYAPTYSERWSLSINAPIAALREGAA